MAAPVDTNVKIPSAVTRGAAAADDLHRQAYTPEGTPPTPAEPAAPAPAAAPPTPAPTAPSADNPNDSWEQRFRASEGRLNAARATMTQQQGEITNLTQQLIGKDRLLATLAAAPAPTAPAPTTPLPAELSAAALQDRETFGEDFIGAAERAAERAFKPQLDAANAEIARLREQLGGVTNVVVGSAREKMIGRLDAEVPNWREQNEDPQYLAWLRLPDPYSGGNRGAMLKEAFSANDAARVIAFFKGFLTEGATVAPATPAAPTNDGRPSLEDLAAPGRAKSEPVPPGSPNDKEIITRAEVAQFYADSRAGKFKGREAEKDALERRLFEAERDGRIR